MSSNASINWFKENNVAVLNDTLAVCERGYYDYMSGRVDLKLDKDRMMADQVYEPRQLDELRKAKLPDRTRLDGVCGFSVADADSFTVARKAAESSPEDKVLVLNLANGTHKGGGVRRGAKAQEEDLCRQSTLLMALEGDEAASYYEYNKANYSRMGSDAVILIPEVEIFKDANYQYLKRTSVVSVITCAAPILDPGMPVDKRRYRDMMYHRIEGILTVAAYHGYTRLILGAFGCGAFHNDAAVVSDIFLDVFRNFRLDGMGAGDLFKNVIFAVLTTPGKTNYNFREFYRNFGDLNILSKSTEEVSSIPEFIGFWHEYDEHGCLSNWYKAEFEYAGRKYASVEQFMMYHKLMTFRQFDLADRVMQTDDPAEAKQIGRTRFSNFDDTLWTRISPTIVKRGVRAKFEQNPELLEELLSTGNAVLAECSPYDKMWGIGLAPDDKNIFDTSRWNGKNKLGRILMVLREEFRNWLADPKKEPPAYVDARDLSVIPEWEMKAGLLKMVPQYHDAIDAYSATLTGQELAEFYKYPFALIEAWIKSPKGDGLPEIGFYEMKQEIYDIARRLK